MALGNGWSSKAPLTINSSQVPANATDLPVLIVYANLPSSITDTSGGCKADGSDIRFTDDASGTTEYAREIIQVDKDNDIVTCYVKIPSVSSSNDTTFYVWWNNPNAEEPSETSASGSRTVWTDYYGVYHFGVMNDGWKGIKDSAGTWSYFTAIGTIEQGDGHADGMPCAEISPTFGMNLPETLYYTDNNKDMMFWVNGNGTDILGTWASGTNGITMGFLTANQFGQSWGGFTTYSGAISNTGWHHILVKIPTAGGTGTSYVNMANAQSGGTSGGNNYGTIGTGTSSSPTHSLSEFRITRESNLSVDYYTTMYANESNPSAFITAGTPITVSASISINITVVDENLNPIETAYVYVDEDFIDPQIMNTTTNASGFASATYDGASVSATLRVRKYGYKAFKTPLTLATDNINQTVTMITDPQQI